jgi:hypothetical protein
MMKALTALALTFSLITANAAPHPLTGSSIVNNPTNSLAFSQMGFSVEGIPHYWIYNKAIDTKANSKTKMLEIGLPQRTLLSFRLEVINPKATLEPYVRQYLRDYNQYGFEVAGLQSLQRNGVNFVIVDLNQKNKTTRTRQLFFHNKEKMVIATCSDDTYRFENTLKLCNSILSTFKWKNSTSTIE